MKKIGLDAGSTTVKVVGAEGVMKFPSDLGEFRDLALSNDPKSDDMIYEFKGVKGFAGTLAKYESEFSGTIMGDTKANRDLIIKTLIALHRYTDDTNFKLVVGQPILTHVDAEKKKIKKILEGEHEFTLNGQTKVITIHEVNVGPEGASAYWSNPKKERMNIIDLGGGTVNLAAIDHGRMIDRQSTTLVFGADSTEANNLDAMVRAIVIAATKKKWRSDDITYTIGGKAEVLVEKLSDYYESVDILRPRFKLEDKISMIPPIFATAVGLYEIAKKVYH